MNPSAMEWEWGLEGRRNDGEADTSSHSGHFLPEALQKKHIVDSDITRVGLDLLPALRTALSRLEEIGDSVAVALLRRVISDMRHTPSTESGIDYSKLMSNEASESAVSDLYWYLMDQINGLHWRDVAKATRDAFSAMSLFVCKQALSAWSGDELALKEMYKVCDIAILLGSDFAYDELQNLLHQLDQISAASFATISDEKHIKVHPSWRHPVCCKSYLPPILQPRQKRLGGVLELAQPVPISTLRDDFMSRSVPVKFKRGIIEHWPARGPGERAWNNVDYILRVAGHRTVPVELGNYLSDASSQALMTVDEFVHTFLINDLEHNVHESNEIDAESELSPSGPPERKRPRPSPVQKSLSDIGYLAQHRLLHQVSQLRRDISIPDYCSILLPEDLMQDDTEAEDIDQEEDDVQVNAWLGPVGTVSPLHHDPYHNLLAQVHGYKYVRLFASSQSAKLYACSGRMSNNSPVDVLSLDESKHPDAVHAEYMDTVLCPGEVLYIPRHCWHFIASIDRDTAAAIIAASACRQGSMQSSSSVVFGERSDEQDDSKVEEGDTPCWSVNFWWGRRILKS